MPVVRAAGMAGGTATVRRRRAMATTSATGFCKQPEQQVGGVGNACYSGNWSSWCGAIHLSSDHRNDGFIHPGSAPSTSLLASEDWITGLDNILMTMDNWRLGVGLKPGGMPCTYFVVCEYTNGVYQSQHANGREAYNELEGISVELEVQRFGVEDGSHQVTFSSVEPCVKIWPSGLWRWPKSEAVRELCEKWEASLEATFAIFLPV